MPFYAYKCESCGFAKDVLQKMSDAQLTLCPSCGADAFRKQVTAAGFQLKGSGWYVTDFRSGNTGGKETPKDGAKETQGEGVAPAPAAPAGKGDAPAAAPSPSAAPASTPAPAPGSGSTGGSSGS